jgi:hypothetical protein
MKFLCLAYGAEKDWLDLSEARRQELLAQDEVLRQRGDLVAAVHAPTVVRAWDGTPTTSTDAYANGPAPLAGFALVEAADLDEVIGLVAGTPCAVARGAIEIRPLL